MELGKSGNNGEVTLLQGLVSYSFHSRNSFGTEQRLPQWRGYLTSQVTVNQDCTVFEKITVIQTIWNTMYIKYVLFAVWKEHSINWNSHCKHTPTIETIDVFTQWVFNGLSSSISKSSWSHPLPNISEGVIPWQVTRGRHSFTSQTADKFLFFKYKKLTH